MLMGEPLVPEETTMPIQYKDSILCPISYKDQLFQQVQVRFRCVETCYWFYYPQTHNFFYNYFFSCWMI